MGPECNLRAGVGVTPDSVLPLFERKRTVLGKGNLNFSNIVPNDLLEGQMLDASLINLVCV
jgi:hypothetical protein